MYIPKNDIHNPEGVARGIMNIIRGYIHYTPRTGHAIFVLYLWEAIMMTYKAPQTATSPGLCSF